MHDSGKGVSEKLIDKLVADAEVSRSVESLRRASDNETLDEAFVDLVGAIKAELGAECRERLLSDEVFDLILAATDLSGNEAVALQNLIIAALKATHQTPEEEEPGAEEKGEGR